MARLGLPIFLARCSCGALLIQDFQGGDKRWTHYCPYVESQKGKDLPEKECSECGGDEKIPIGAFHAIASVRTINGVLCW